MKACDYPYQGYREGMPFGGAEPTNFPKNLRFTDKGQDYPIELFQGGVTPPSLPPVTALIHINPLQGACIASYVLEGPVSSEKCYYGTVFTGPKGLSGSSYEEFISKSCTVLCF